MSRGRPSAASLTVVPFGEIARPKPPKELSAEQAVEWREIVDAMPADWFNRATFPLLSAYCVHVCRARTLSEMIRRGKDLDETLLAAERAQTRMILTLATKMRLSQQSSYDKSKRRHVVSRELWEP